MTATKKKATAKKKAAPKPPSPSPASTSIARRGQTFAVTVRFTDGSSRSGAFEEIGEALNFVEEFDW